MCHVAHLQKFSMNWVSLLPIVMGKWWIKQVQISLWLLREDTKIKANISLCLQMCRILKLFDMLKYTLFFWRKISNACTWAHTYAKKHMYKNAYFWSLVFNLLFFYQSVFKDNLDSLQIIAENFWLVLFNQKFIDFTSVHWKMDRIACEAKLSCSSLLVRPKKISSRFSSPVPSIMWKCEQGNNKSNANFP